MLDTVARSPSNRRKALCRAAANTMRAAPARPSRKYAWIIAASRCARKYASIFWIASVGAGDEVAMPMARPISQAAT
jgi:hypothetical protein